MDKSVLKRIASIERMISDKNKTLGWCFEVVGKSGVYILLHGEELQFDSIDEARAFMKTKPYCTFITL